MPTPAVRASTTKRARSDEVFDKMTTVRGVRGDAALQLQAAIADTSEMAALREKLQRLEKQQHAKAMKRK